MASEKKGLNDLGLGKEKLEGADFDAIPENLGQAFAPMLQPAKYRFKFPADMATIFDTIDETKHGKRIVALFQDGSELVVVQSPNNARNGEEYRTRITNIPRERTKEKILVSDMDLLLRAVGVTSRPATNLAYGQAMIKLAGTDFGATVEVSGFCNDKKPIYVDDGQGGTQEVADRVGCGTRIYQRDITKLENGDYPERVTCPNPDCGASIRLFTNLTGFTK